MIDQQDIEDKDFSVALPDIAAKILAIGSSLMTYGYAEDSVLESEQCKGFGLFLCEIEDDLMKISNALYGDGKLPVSPQRKEPDGES